MKTLPIILLLSLNIFANELQWVDEQIEAIKPPRDGIRSSRINAVKTPFISLTKDEDKKDNAQKKVNKNPSSIALTNTKKVIQKSRALSLKAIINSSALINGKWYKLYDKVGKYTLTKVDRTGITLSYKKKKLILSTNTKNKNLKFKNN